MSNAIKVLLADGSPLFRQGLQLALKSAGPAVRYTEVDHFEAVGKALDVGGDWHLLILSAELPGLSQWQQLERLSGQKKLPVLVTTASAPSDFVRRAVRHGARGVIHKRADLVSFRDAVNRVLAGECWHACAQTYQEGQGGQEPVFDRLSDKEINVLRLLSEGLMNKHIARRLSVHESTVKRHVSSIYRKFQVENRTGLMGSIGQLPSMEWGQQ